MNKYSINITLDEDKDLDIIMFFKSFEGKKVDALRCMANGYFKSKTNLSDEQKNEINKMINHALSKVSLNIKTDNININSDNINHNGINKNLLNNELKELENRVNNCGIKIEF